MHLRQDQRLSSEVSLDHPKLKATMLEGHLPLSPETIIVSEIVTGDAQDSY